MDTKQITNINRNNTVCEYDIEVLQKQYTNMTEQELSAAIALMMLYHSATPFSQTTPVNEEPPQPIKKPLKVPSVRKIRQRRNTVSVSGSDIQRSNINKNSIHRPASTRALLSTCRNILSEFVRNNF